LISRIDSFSIYIINMRMLIFRLGCVIHRAAASLWTRLSGSTGSISVVLDRAAGLATRLFFDRAGVFPSIISPLSSFDKRHSTNMYRILRSVPATDQETLHDSSICQTRNVSYRDSEFIQTKPK
jgi:hypothetical protein